ncbi:alcohol dehydrogenase catalytic domain-containing protein [Cutibacterium namnetense]|uniref:alcohol dehydrogenase catalytic domain-containing protein n=1 Tax=Cutibacterium namnetense TaxID=1574624 RepID=UPI0007C7F125|nr:alcohol dehydrogenase catalytic domain-containing protein [Cutibacterium namnetense]TKW71832.1 MAG: zinc-binding dehydrogenase [Cutibacterium acnes]
MMHTMPALVLNGPGDVQLTEKPIPTPGPGEVVLAVEATTICGTDLRIMSGEKTTGVRPGVTLGHEIAGRIASLGEGVEGLTAGQQATVSIVVSCGTCRACLTGREHLCSRCELVGYGIDGGLAPWLRVPARAVRRGNIISVAAEMPATRLALAEPLSCVLNGHRRHSGVNPGETVVIIGGGAIGLLHTELNLACGAGRVIVCEKHADRRDRAAAMGAVTTCPEHLSEVVAEHTGGYGAELVIVAIGRNELAEESLSLAAPGGRVSWFAGFPKGSMASITPNTVHYQELTVSGGSNAGRADVHRAVDMLEGGDIDEAPIVTHTFGLSQWTEAVDAVRGHAGVKIAIDPQR